MALKTNSSSAAFGLDAILNALGSSSKVRIYSGTQPASITGAETTILAELAILDSDPFGGATTANPPVATGNLSGGKFAEDTSIDTTGTATWFRLLDSSNNPIIQGSVGTSGADLNLNSTSLIATGSIVITSFTISLTGIQ